VWKEGWRNLHEPDPVAIAVQLTEDGEAGTTTEDMAAAADRLAAARSAVAALAGTRAADARRLAGLLTAALEHQRSHAGEPCPVCGAGVLDEAWADTAEDSIAELTAQAADADAAFAEETAAAGALGRLVPRKPTVLAADLGPELDPAAASARWDRWASEIAAMTSAAASSGGDAASSGGSEVRAAFEALSAAVAELRSSAGKVLQDRAAAWQPLARDLALWSEVARNGDHASVLANELRKAIDWLRATGKEAAAQGDA
jgi:hypothetical protein